MTTQTTAPRSAPSAAAEYGLGHDLESDLPVIPALAEIDHIRVIDKSGASYRATPAQMREMVGIDYSILTEQAVPGEYWIGADGKRRQVYIRTFYGAFPTSLEIGGIHAYLTPVGYVDMFQIVNGAAVSTAGGAISRNIDSYMPYNSATLSTDTFTVSKYLTDRLLIHANSISFSGYYYSVTLKFTKK